jgi:hypothetical protein
MQSKAIASAPNFDLVGAEELNERNQGRLMVHVSGWNKGMKFIWMGTVSGQHILRTPKGGIYYRTYNPLLHLRSHTIKTTKTVIRLKDLF